MNHSGPEFPGTPKTMFTVRRLKVLNVDGWNDWMWTDFRRLKFLNPKTGRSLVIFLTQKNISLAVHLSANYHSFFTAVHFWSFYERDRGIITFREEGLPVEEFYFRYFLYFKTNFSRFECQDVINRWMKITISKNQKTFSDWWLRKSTNVVVQIKLIWVHLKTSTDIPTGLSWHQTSPDLVQTHKNSSL